jgi:hypothetical protein
LDLKRDLSDPNDMIGRLNCAQAWIILPWTSTPSAAPPILGMTKRGSLQEAEPVIVGRRIDV